MISSMESFSNVVVPFETLKQCVINLYKLTHITIQASVPPNHRFTQVISLILSGSILMSLDILKTIIDLNQIETLDVYSIESLSINGFYELIKHLPRLNELTMEFNPLFVVPLQIHILRLEDDSRRITIDTLYHTIHNVKTLEIPKNSRNMMIDIIDQLKNLDNIMFTHDEFSQDADTDFFLKKLSFRWFENNSYRLAT
ncbi:unnamed protein product [Rotaria sp. Silwood1]|nr:unnamed protein product [Rotaria sp. Silwood1]CAF1626477.1 unnamed protein product [Rotaria sp. Silwood1]